MTPNTAPSLMTFAVAAPAPASVPLAIPGEPGTEFAVMVGEALIDIAPDAAMDHIGLIVERTPVELPTTDLQAEVKDVIERADDGIVELPSAGFTLLQSPSSPAHVALLKGPVAVDVPSAVAPTRPEGGPKVPPVASDPRLPMTPQSSLPTGNFIVRSHVAPRAAPSIPFADTGQNAPKLTPAEPYEIATTSQIAPMVGKTDPKGPHKEDYPNALLARAARRGADSEGQIITLDTVLQRAEPEHVKLEVSKRGAAEMRVPAPSAGRESGPAHPGKPSEIIAQAHPASLGPKGEMPVLSETGKNATAAPIPQPFVNPLATHVSALPSDHSLVALSQASQIPRAAIQNEISPKPVEQAFPKAVPSSPRDAIHEAPISVSRPNEAVQVTLRQAIAPLPAPKLPIETLQNAAPIPAVDRIDVLAPEQAEFSSTPVAQDEAPIRTSRNARPDLPAAPPVRQILAAVIANPSAQSVEIALHPEELGKVEIRMTGRGDEMSIQIIAQRDDTAALLRRHLPDLAAEFRQMGFTDLNFSFGEDRQHHPAATDGHRVGEGLIRMDADTTPIPMTTIPTDRLNLRV